MPAEATEPQWTAHPVRAAVIRVVVLVAPLAGSIAFVHYASRLFPPPTGSFLVFAAWWAVLSGGATLVLVVLERVARRALPLVALYRLSLVFPDAAPSRFKAAVRTNTVETLAER